jgi:hypothetical protein
MCLVHRNEICVTDEAKDYVQTRQSSFLASLIPHNSVFTSFCTVLFNCERLISVNVSSAQSDTSIFRDFCGPAVLKFV